MHAKSCEVREVVDNSLIKDFLNRNHSQGYVKSNFKCGLFYKNELVMLMTFGKPRYDKNYQWEIIRECTKKDYTVYEGCSTLWNFFISSRSVRSCVVYSYPHNGDFTSHYVDYCGFKNITKSRDANRLVYVGTYNGKDYKITEQELFRNGVDRILGTNIGLDKGSNKDILVSLGFRQEFESCIKPQKDIYFPFGVVFKATDLDSGKFYIGETRVKGKIERGYLGSGIKWINHLNKYPDKRFDKDNPNAHLYEIKILKDDFDTPKELRQFEIEMIKEYGEYDEEKNLLTNINCMNLTLREQGEYNKPEVKVCSECGGRSGQHKKSCSQYKGKLCEECGSTGVVHYKTCSKFKRFDKKSVPCPHCGGKAGHHYKYCRFYKEKQDKVCGECGGKYGHHKKTCSSSRICPECGAGNGRHFGGCSMSKKCPECGGVNNTHKKYCSKYKRKDVEPCPECGAKHTHLKTCSRYYKNTNKKLDGDDR